MAHEVQSMFSVKETPWHGLGHIVREAPTAEEAIKLAGLNWSVEEKQLYSFDPATEKFVRCKSHKALHRSDNDDQLSVVGVGYEPLQNEKAFSFFDPFIESGLASFETAGALRQGKTIWILAKLNKAPIDIGRGDTVDKYLLLSNGHDGLMAVRTGFTPIRVVCANTLAMSHNTNESRLLRINHSKRVNDRLDQVREIINAADAKFEATAEQYRALAKADVDQKALEKYVEIVFDFKSIDAQRREIARTKAVENIQRLFETGYGANLKTANGTAWGLYNSVTQYLSYEQGKSQDSRLNNLWFGQSRNVNRRALDAAIELVGA
jgi:phage/plasmid-like protein (TIGR03299 family)